MLTQQELMDFEQGIADAFNNKEIPYPIHLSKGNEQFLIEYFERNFKEGDWIFNSWRSHLHALLAGVPADKVREAIMRGRSMTLCWPEHKMFCSAIVGGVIPIAVGIAWQIKRNGGKEIVHLFVGDMTAQTGIAMECHNYVKEHDLPIKWIVEDNGKSVCTITKGVWPEYRGIKSDYYYQWDLSAHYPHAGSGKRIQF